MTDAIIATIESVRTRASTQEALLTLSVPLEQAALISGFISKIGKHVGVAFAEVEQGEALAAAPKPPQEEKPYGKLASELYRVGFFFNPKVLKAIGTDAEYLEWIEKLPCCAPEGEITWGAVLDTDAIRHSGDIVAAHVRRIANGAGAAIKPPYSAIPLCDAHHKLQHQKGESVFPGGKDWFDKQRAKYVQEWASHYLADHLGFKSMGHIHPELLRAWATANDIGLPFCYAQEFTNQTDQPSSL